MRSIDKICDLVEAAHAIFPENSVFEVIDLDKPAATAVLNKAHNYPGADSIDRYLSVIERLKCVTG